MAENRDCVPAGWRLSKVKYVADFMPRCNTHGLKEDTVVGYAPMDCIKNGFFIQRSEEYGSIPASLTPYATGDIVMAKVTPCFENGNIAIMTDVASGVGFGSSELFVFRAKAVETRFLFYWLQNLDFVHMATASMTGMGGLKRVPASVITNAIIGLPSQEEQRRIASFLDAKCGEVNALAADIQSQIDTLEQYKRSVVTKAVTKGLDPDAEKRDSGIPWIETIPLHWKTVRMKYLFSNGKGLPITKENLTETGLPVISYGQIHAKSNSGTDVDESLLRYVDPKYQVNYPQCEVFQYDFVFADTSEDYDGCGNCVYKRDALPLFAGYHSIIMHSLSKHDNRYYAYLFKTDCWRKQIREAVSGVKVFSITQKSLMNSTLIVPPDDEQQAIADFLDNKCAEIDSIIADKKQQLETLDEYKKSLIFEYVTGKKEVSSV